MACVGAVYSDNGVLNSDAGWGDAREGHAGAGISEGTVALGLRGRGCAVRVVVPPSRGDGGSGVGQNLELPRVGGGSGGGGRGGGAWGGRVHRDVDRSDVDCAAEGDGRGGIGVGSGGRVSE